MPSIRRSVLLWCLFCVSVTLASPLNATLQVGDVVAAEFVNTNFGFHGRLNVYRNGVRQQQIDQFLFTNPRGLALDPNGKLYVTTTAEIRVYDSNGAPLRPFAENLEGQFPSFIVFDASGNGYLGLGGISAQILKLDANGSIVAKLDPQSSEGIWAADLAADQCTLFFSSFRVLRAYDICAAKRLPDVATLPPSASILAIRVLPDGTILVAGNDAVYRLNRSGQVLRTYTAPLGRRWSAVAVDPGAHTFWTATGNVLYQFAIESGDLLQGPFSTELDVNSLVVVGEPRAAIEAARIPTLNTIGLITLLVTLALVGFFAVSRAM